MENNIVLVLADPTDRRLAMLEALPEETEITVGNCVEAFARSAPKATVILNWSKGRDLLEKVWRMAPRLRWIHTASAGLEHMLFPELIESAVPLTNARGVFSESLGEFTLGAVLFFAKDFRRMIRNQEAGRWEQFDVAEIAGQTIGIVGYGDIGRAVAARARAMRMNVLALRRRPELSREDPLVDEMLPAGAMKELLARSDYVTVCTPLTPGTRGMIGEAALRSMKATAVLINVGRGATIDETALARALEEHWIRGAALDVFEREPLPEGHPFYRLDNVLLSPHCADHTADWLDRNMRFFLENFARFRKGEPLLNVVDKRRGY